MQPVRSFQAEKAFEELWARRDDANTLVQLAHQAARRGRTEEVEVCLAKLYLVAPARVEELSHELYAVLRSVHAHPSYRGRTARGRRAS